MEIKTDGHTFIDNNFVYISGIADTGPTELNDKVFQIFDAIICVQTKHIEYFSDRKV